MSRFTNFTSILLPTKDNPLYTTTEDLVYSVGYEGSSEKITVPSGFSTDFASLPWVVTILWSKDDHRWVKSTILHDYGWSISSTLSEYQKANEIFYEAMIVEGTPKYLAIPFYLAVSISKYLYFITK